MKEDTRGQLFERVVRVEALLEGLVWKLEHYVVRDGIGLNLIHLESQRLSRRVFW